MRNTDSFIKKYGNVTEEYKFNEHILRYDPVKHIYYLMTASGLEVLEGVSTISHIIDKSDILMPWACKMMAQKLMTTLQPFVVGHGSDSMITISSANMGELIQQSKKAHKERLEDACKVGKSAHGWIESYIKYQLGTTSYLPPKPEEPRSANACDAALDWMMKHNVRWKHTECKVYNHHWKYAGTMDGLCLTDSCSNPSCCPVPFSDRLTLADWKTSNYLYIEFILQTGAYKLAYEEETGEKVEDIWIIRLGKEDAEFDAWHLNQPMIQFGTEAFICALELSRTIDKLETEIAYVKDQIRAKEREEALKIKEAALKLNCVNSSKYKGIRAPRCNGGNPCESCVKKYSEVQAQKTLDKSS